MSDGPNEDFQLYYTRNGLVQISGEIRRSILAELHKGDMTLTDLSRSIGKAQSTLSVHLDRMVEDGLIAVKDDPNDSRRKVYSIVSVMLANSKESSEESMHNAMSMLSKVVHDPEQVSKALPRFIFMGFDGLGLSFGPMAKLLGAIHAVALDGSLTGETIEDTVSNARSYFGKIGLGEVTIFSLKPMTIIIKDDEPFTEGIAQTIGGYAIGFFCKILEDATGNQYDVVSSEIFGSESNYFKFTVEPK